MAKMIGSGQITLYDMNDITSSPTQPTNPTPDMIWMDTATKPYKFYIYRTATGKFEDTGFTSLQELDPEAAQQVDYAYNGVLDLSLDNKLTRFERSLVREELANMIGVFLAAADTMPTISQIDANGIGDLYSIRKESLNLGLPTTDAAYVRLGAAYINLRTYLSGTTVKAWDISSADTITIVSATWDAKWNEYNLAYNNLKVINGQRTQQYADLGSDQAKKDAIAAVSNSLEHATVALVNPTTIDAPIATIALPEFSGQHVDSWEYYGRNLLSPSSNFTDVSGFTSYTGVSNIRAEGGLLKATGTGASSRLILKGGYSYVSGEKFTITMVYKRSIASPSLSINCKFFSGTNFVTEAGTGPVGTVNTEAEIDGFVKATVTLTMPVRATAASEVVKFMPYITNSETAATTIEIKTVMLQRGAVGNPYSQAPEETFPTFGNRIKPVTNPTFVSGTTMTLLTRAYGDGVDNDTVAWNTLGNAVRTKKWEDLSLDGSLNWVYGSDLAGAKVLMVPAVSSSVPVHTTLQGVKNNGNFLTRVTTVNAADQVMIDGTNGNLTISVSDSDSGWGESYVPIAEEIKAYFFGWRLCNGTFGVKYTGATSDVKTWYPIGDADLARATTETPDDNAASVVELTLNKYQIVYRLQDPVQETIDFNGILNIIQGVNSIRMVYPLTTPDIKTGIIKYATNIATATRDISYLIPTVQNRIAKAEEVITDESIINKVMSSVDYKVAMTGKASLTDLAGLATDEALDGVSKKVDDEVANALKLLNFNTNDPFVQTSVLENTASDIKAKFSATGGMNLIKNSIGYAGLDAWTSLYASLVTTINSDELDNIGFGSGFVFKANGQNKGISQTITCISGQPYTLGWYLNKTNSGTDSSHRFFIEILENDVVTAQVADNSNVITDGYKDSYINYTPQTSTMTIRFVGYGNVEATLTGVMLTIGDMPLQWSLSTGELYNTNIRLDINGIKVSQINDKRVEIGYTLITPNEFAGYALVGKQFEKIFYLSGQQTVTKKLKAEVEIAMGTIKAVKVNSGTNNGWAFIRNTTT